MVEILRRRAEFTRRVREFFGRNSYLEVDTPLVSPFLIPEPSLEVFRTEVIDPKGNPTEAYLIPSPELWMKRLLVRGSGSIYQITGSFRNMEFTGRLHSPEFTLLEWYTVGNDYKDEMGIMEDFLEYLGDLDWAGGIPLPPKRLSMKAAFRDILDLKLDELMDVKSLVEAAQSFGLEEGEDEDWEVVFQKLFVSEVEPELEGSLFLYDYPSRIPCLAKNRGPYSERWELYLGGVETANCYSEETSPVVLKRLFRSEASRKKRCRVSHRVDWQLIEHLEDGLPECSGVALGMDRLLMILSGEKSIDNVLPFPFSRIFH